MKRVSLLILAGILAFSVIPADAQINKIKAKIKEKVQTSEKADTENDEKSSSTNSSTDSSKKSSIGNSDYLFLSKNDLDGKSISSLSSCMAATHLMPPMSRVFKQWITDISENSALKMFNIGRCDVVGYHIDDKPSYGYRNIDSFNEIASGLSVYKVETDSLILVKKFDDETYYIVVSGPNNGTPTLEVLDVCGPPQIIKRIFDAKKASLIMGTNCHDLEDQIYKVKNPSKYAAHMNRTSAVLFEKADYEEQKKNGLFAGKAVYILVDEERLEPVK